PNIQPSSSCPFVLTKDVLLEGNCLRYRGLKILYSAITTLNYQARMTTVNGVQSNKKNSLKIRLNDGTEISVSCIGVFFETDKYKRISSAYEFLSKATFDQRLSAYTSRLEKDGFFMIDNVRIYANGDVEKDGLRINMTMAAERRTLQFGTSWGIEIG